MNLMTTKETASAALLAAGLRRRSGPRTPNRRTTACKAPALDKVPLDYYDDDETSVPLIAEGYSDPEAIHGLPEALDSRYPTPGARVVVKAWTDPEFRQRLLTNGRRACEELSITFHGDTRLTVLENTDTVHHLIFCTLRSCYPRPLLGRPPDWYRLMHYRTRALRDPRMILAEFGSVIPDDMEVRVHDSTAKVCYMVLPLRPAGTRHYNEEQLATLVTRDAMIGVIRIRLARTLL
jgi:hypothetical protein